MVESGSKFNSDTVVPSQWHAWLLPDQIRQVQRKKCGVQYQWGDRKHIWDNRVLDDFKRTIKVDRSWWCT